MKIATIVGARPQFIKLALLSRRIRKRHKEILIHTGQHYDGNLSDIFFKELRLPRPDCNLGVISDKQGEQVAYMLKGIERILLRVRPDLVIVYGDTNSTLAGALAAAKLNIPIAHVEAGLRSFRRDMPEEINRILTDHLSTFLFCPTSNAVKNLKREGITEGVYNVGDVMHDAMLYYLNFAKKKSNILTKLILSKNSYFLATIHRAKNTDSKARLRKIISIFMALDKPVIFPVHPRTRKVLVEYGIKNVNSNIRFIDPVSYFDMIILERNAYAVLTDSGGVQKEAYFLNVPCLTLREETEWLETVNTGGNKVIGINKANIIETINKFGSTEIRNNPRLFGEGSACKKIIKILEEVILKSGMRHYL